MWQLAWLREAQQQQQQQQPLAAVWTTLAPARRGLSDEAGDWVDDPSSGPAAAASDGTAVAAAAPDSILAALGKLRVSRGTSSSSSSSKPGLAVVVCESRPLNEGVTMARRLAAAGLDAAGSDAQAGVFIDQVDVVLLGADRRDAGRGT